MWGHYANGFRGVAIEIEVCENEVNKIKYKREILIEIFNFDKFSWTWVLEILNFLTLICTNENSY